MSAAKHTPGPWRWSLQDRRRGARECRALPPLDREALRHADRRGRRDASRADRPAHGLLAPTIDGGYVLAYWDGSAEKQPLAAMLPAALIRPDGSAKIVEPDYDSRTAVSKAMRESYERAAAQRQSGRF